MNSVFHKWNVNDRDITDKAISKFGYLTGTV